MKDGAPGTNGQTPPEPKPAGPIRKGQKTGFKKCTNATMTKRVEALVEFMQSKPLSTTAELKSFIKENFQIKWRHAVNYITRARDEIRKRSNMTKDDARAIVIPTLLNEIKCGTPPIRLKAIQQLVEIYGLKSPVRAELTGAEGGPIAMKDESDPLDGLTIEDLKKLANAVADK